LKIHACRHLGGTSWRWWSN